jgi:hypothetical protein
VVGEDGEFLHWGTEIPGSRGDAAAAAFSEALRGAGEGCASRLAEALRASVPDGAHVLLIQLYADKTQIR